MIEKICFIRISIILFYFFNPRLYFSVTLTLKEQIASEELRLEQLRGLLINLKDEPYKTDINMRALDGYRLVRELSATSSTIQTMYSANITVLDWINKFKSQGLLPDESDLVGAAKSFLRLQRTYLL